MSGIRTKKTKRVTNEILARYDTRFKKDFENNKKALDLVSEIPSKRLRNIIAGYITKLKNKEKLHS